MKLKLVKPSRGIVWVRQGLLACRQQPLGYVGLVGLMFMLTFLLVPLPGPLGAMVFAGLMPVLWMGFILATRRVLTGQRISPTVLFEALKGPDAPRQQFAVLGGVYVLASIAIQQLAGWLGPGAEEVDKAVRATQDPSALGNDPVILRSLLWRLGLTVPVTLLFWHAPALLVWARIPVAKALFFSAVATWRNIGAFITYGAAWMGLMLVIALLDSVLVMIIPLPSLANMLAVVASMLLAAAFYASLYFTVVDCFEASQPAEPVQDDAAPAP